MSVESNRKLRALRLPSDAYLRRTYGISIEDYKALLAYQGGRCFVCHRKPRMVALAVDHNHNMPPGRDSVRGLLCGRSGKDSAGRDYPACNRIIGMAHDNPQFFRRAADYLENPPFQRMAEAQEGERLAEIANAHTQDGDLTGESGWWAE